MTTLTKTFPVTSSSIRFKRTKDGKYFVAGKNTHLAGGRDTTGADAGVYRTYLRASIASTDWTDVVEVISANLVLMATSDGTNAFPGMGAPTDGTDVEVTALDSLFADNSTVGLSPDWTGDITPALSNASQSAKLKNDIGLAQRVGIKKLVRYWAPKSVKVTIGDTKYPGLAKTNRGLQLVVTNDSTHQFVFASELNGDLTAQPFIELIYVSKPLPGVLFPTDPPASIPQTEGHYFEGDYVPGRTDDYLVSVQLQVYPGTVASTDYNDSGSKAVWPAHPDLFANVSASEAATNHFRTLIGAALRSGTAYKWRARAKNQRGETTAWTAVSPLLVNAEAPVLSNLSPGPATFSTLNNAIFRARYSDTNTTFSPPLRYRVQLALSPAPVDWDDPDANLQWNVEIPARDAETAIKTDTIGKFCSLSLDYGGAGLPAGAYVWRMQATSLAGADSAWVLGPGPLTITVGETPDPGDEDLATGYLTRRTRARIILRKMGVNRGPGAVAAIIEDAGNIGASEFHNSAGEFFFSLPAIHPQVSVIEPFQVHYALEVYRGEGWKELTSGLIVDFDATDDDVVFYGTDYLGILGLDIDERFNPTSNIDAAAGIYPAAGAGSKYSDRTITTIVGDQIDRAIHHTGSPLAFFTRGATAAMNERVTIWSTFKPRLSFIAGLLDSHRGTNLGSRTRLRVRKTTAGGYSFVVEDNPGKDRDNIRLSYGELINGFRVVPFGEWASRVHAIGRAVQGSKVEYIANVLGTAPEATFGRIPKVNVWQDITDKADLTRRAQLYARSVSKLGKRISLAIRVDSIGVKDGWDICDSFPVKIDRGVVNTDAYGSGLWTCWGWSWQLYPDGHTDLTLSLSPKLDAEPPSTDLIASDPIHTTPEWAIGHGPPTATTFALLATATWVDGDTGEVYEYNGETAVWDLTDQAVGGLPGPEGPPGPPGPAGAGVVNVGTWRWVTSAGPPSNSTMDVTTQPPVPGAATTLEINENDATGADRSPYLDSIQQGDSIVIDDQTGNVWQHEVTGPIVDNGTWRSVPIIYDPRAPVVGQPANNQQCDVLYLRAADVATDTIPPAAPVIASFGSRQTVDNAGSLVIALAVDVIHPTTNADASLLTDLFGTSVQVTSDNDGNPDPDLVMPVWTDPTTLALIGPDETHGELPGVAGVTRFWARAQSVDVSGNASLWSALEDTTTGRDIVAPAVPSGLLAVAGYRSAGLTWTPATEPDYAFNEVRYAPDNGTGTAPDTTVSTWGNVLRLKSNTMVISALTPAVLYWFQVRRVDTSGNVATSDLDPTAVDYLASPDAGWSVLSSATPTLIGASDVAFNALVTNLINTGVLSADMISTGTLKVTTSGGATGFEVWSGAVRIGLWDATGLYIGTTLAGGTGLPADLSSSDYIRLTEAGLTVYLGGVPTTAITPAGIDASAINLGRLPGGHNLVKNSSFELAAFSATAATPKDWDVAANWTASSQSNANTTVGAGGLTVTGTTF